MTPTQKKEKKKKRKKEKEEKRKREKEQKSKREKETILFWYSNIMLPELACFLDDIDT